MLPSKEAIANMLLRKPTLWTILFFILLTVIGLAVTPDYGIPFDEGTEQAILRGNIKEYACTLLGEDTPTMRSDEWAGVTRISASVERDHGQSAYYPLAGLLWLQKAAPRTFMILWHAYTWLWFMGGVLAAFLLAHELGLNRLLACATSLLVYLNPRFFAEGHYNNKDVILLSLVLCVLAAGARFMRQPSIRHSFWLALFGALATNTKIVGAYAVLLMGLAAVWYWHIQPGDGRRRLRATILTLGLYLILYTLVTPALWADPILYVQYVVRNATGFARWTGVVLYKGALYQPSNGLPLPHSYLPVMMAITIPVLFWVMMAVGQAYAVVRCVRRDPRRPLLCAITALWIIPAAFVIIRQPLMYNGWRHFYFLYAGLAMLGGLGMQAIAQRLQQRRGWQKAVAVALGMLLGYQAIGMAANHPNQYAYYNELVSKNQTDFELDYWALSTLNAMRTLSSTTPGEDIIAVSASDPMSLLALQNGMSGLTPAERQRLRLTNAEEATYLIDNTLYSEIYKVQTPKGFEPLFTIRSYGNALCVVYRKAVAPSA